MTALYLPFLLETATDVVVFILFLFPSTTIIPHFTHFVHKKLQKIKIFFIFLKKHSPLYILYSIITIKSSNSAAKVNKIHAFYSIFDSFEPILTAPVIVVAGSSPKAKHLQLT